MFVGNKGLTTIHSFPRGKQNFLFAEVMWSDILVFMPSYITLICTNCKQLRVEMTGKPEYNELR